MPIQAISTKVSQNPCLNDRAPAINAQTNEIPVNIRAPAAFSSLFHQGQLEIAAVRAMTNRLRSSPDQFGMHVPVGDII